MNNLPIRFKLIIHFLLVSILPSIVLAVFVSYTVDRIIEKQVNEHTLQLIGKVNKSLEFYAGNMQNISYFISFNPEVERFLAEESLPEAADPQADMPNRYELRRFLQGFTTLYPEVAGILVLNANGDYVSNELYARSAKKLTDEDWYREAVENKGIFKILGHPNGRNITSHVNYKDEEVISVVRAIVEPETQRVKGVVLIDLKLRVIAETAKDVRLGKTGFLMVLDQAGEFIYTPSHSVVSKISSEWFADGSSGTFSKQVEGRKLQFIYRKSPFTNWTTVGVFSTVESVPEVREIRFYVVSFVFFVCMIGIAVSFYLSYSISRPIGQLMSFMKKAESGDLTIRYIGKRFDEIGQLGRSFNKMLAQINKLLFQTEQQERQKREAELKSLQAHIKPHFLYNTLDTIHWMARKKGADDVAEVVEALSRLFRLGLSRGQDRIPIMDEIEHIRSYLQIQKTRYKDKLNYSLAVDPKVQDSFVLKLVLQPVVENAIYHGIKERRGPGHIDIEAFTEGDILVLRVQDDGAGMSEEKLAGLRACLVKASEPPERLRYGGGFAEGSGALVSSGASGDPRLPEAGGGYGLGNVQQRIQLVHGEAYGLTVESEAGKGTVVTITLPLLKDIRYANGER